MGTTVQQQRSVLDGIGKGEKEKGREVRKRNENRSGEGKLIKKGRVRERSVIGGMGKGEEEKGRGVSKRNENRSGEGKLIKGKGKGEKFIRWDGEGREGKRERGKLEK